MAEANVRSIFEELKQSVPEEVDVDVKDIFKEEFAPSKYSNINNLNIGTTSENVDGIGSEIEAMQFAASMGFADTYRGIKQLAGIDESEMQSDQKKLNRIFANKSYGKAALASYMGGVIADPFGWVIPVAKAKSIYDMTKLGVKYGAVFGAAGYTDKDMYDEDSEFWEQKLYQTGLGAAAGGVISGAIGLAGRKAFKFDEEVSTVPVNKQGLTDVQVAELNRTTKKRNTDATKAEQYKQSNLEEKMSFREAFSNRVGKPYWDAITKNPLKYAGGGLGAYGMFSYVEEGNSAKDFALNSGLTALAFIGGKKIGDLVGNTEIANKALYQLNPELYMKPEIYSKWNQMKGTVQTHQQNLARLYEVSSKFTPDESKLAYQLFSGDLDDSLLISLSKGSKLTPEQILKQQELGLIDDITPASAQKILDLNEEKILRYKNLGEDLRLSGLIDDDVFQTNLGSYMNRSYDLINAKLGSKAARTFKKNIGKIKGDGLMGRGILYRGSATAEEVSKLVPGLRAERKADYKIKNDFEKRYSFEKAVDNVTDDDLIKNGKLINRVDEEVDPDFVKGINNLDQSSNYGVIVKKVLDKDNNPTGKYDITMQLTKKERIDLAEIEDVALSITRTMKELSTTVGLGRFYQGTYDIGRRKGFVLNFKDTLSRAFYENGNIGRVFKVNKKGEKVEAYTNDSIISLQTQMSEIRLSQQGINKVPDSFTGRENIEVVKEGLFNKYKQQVTPTGRTKISAQQVPEGGKRITRETNYYETYISGRDTASGAIDKIKKQIDIEQVALNKEAFKVKKDTEKFYKHGTKEPSLVNSGEDLVKVPDRLVQNSTAKEFGKLAGTLVTRDTLRDLELLNKVRSDKYKKGILEKYFSIHTFWKKTKTVLNPAVHVNNLVANVSMFYMANGSWKAFKAAKKDFLNITRYENGLIKQEDLSQDLKDMYKYGGMSGDMVSAELRQDMKIPQYIKSFDVDTSSGTFADVALAIAKKQLTNAKNIFGKYIEKPMSDTYQLEDKIWRLALYKSRLTQRNPKTNQLYTKEEASNDALKWFVDYDIKSPVVNGLRNTVVPFLSYSYRAIPLIAEAAISRPEKFAVMGAVFYALNDLSRAASGSTKAEEEIERSAMQKFRQKEILGMPFMPKANVRLPYNGRDGGAKYFDTSRKFPGGNVFEMGGETGTSIPYLPSALQFGGALVDVANKGIIGRDSFTGQPYPTAGKGPMDIAIERTGEIAKSFIPNVGVGAASQAVFGAGANLNPASQKITQSFSDEYQTLSDPLSPIEAIANTFGLTINTADIERLQTLRGKQLSYLQTEITREIRSLEKQRMKGLIDLEDYEEKYREIKTRFATELEELSE